MTKEDPNPANPAKPHDPAAIPLPPPAAAGGGGGGGGDAAAEGEKGDERTEQGAKPKVHTKEQKLEYMVEYSKKLPDGDVVSLLRALSEFQKETTEQQQAIQKEMRQQQLVMQQEMRQQQLAMQQEMKELRLQTRRERPPGASWSIPEYASDQSGPNTQTGDAEYSLNPGATQQAAGATLGQAAGEKAGTPRPPAAGPTASLGTPKIPPHHDPSSPPPAGATEEETSRTEFHGGTQPHHAPPHAAPNTGPQAKRLVKIPNLRLEKTTFDYDSWVLAFYQHVQSCKVGGIYLDEPSKIDIARQMIGEHDGSSSYYRQAMEWSHVNRTVEEFLECVKEWHDERRTILDPAGKPNRDCCPLDVFARPPGVKMIDWVSSPWLRHHLKSKFQVWPFNDAIIGQVMDTILHHTCHRQALETFIIDENGDWGFTWDVAKIRREIKTPQALLGMLRKWVELNTTLEAEFQQEIKKRTDKQKKDLEDHLAIQRLRTDKIRTPIRSVAITEADDLNTEEVLAVGASRTYPRRESYPRGGRNTTRSATTATTVTGTPCPTCREKDKVDRYHDEKKCFHVVGGPYWWNQRQSKPKNGSAAGKS